MKSKTPQKGSLHELGAALDEASPQDALAMAESIYEPNAPMEVIHRLAAKGEGMVAPTRAALAAVKDSTNWRDESAQLRFVALLGRLGAHDDDSQGLLRALIDRHRDDYRRPLNVVRHTSRGLAMRADVESLCAALSGLEDREDLALRAPMALAQACPTTAVMDAAFAQLLDSGGKKLAPRGADDRYDYEKAFPFLLHHLIALDAALAAGAMGRLLGSGALRSEQLIEAFAPLGHPESAGILIKLLTRKATRTLARNALLSLADQGALEALEGAAQGTDKRLAHAARQVLGELEAMAPGGEVAVTAEVVELLDKSGVREAVELYKKGGARARDRDDQTVLHCLFRDFGAMPNLSEVVVALLGEGADPRAADAQGIRPLPLAVHCDATTPDIVDRLIEAGADPVKDDSPEPPPKESVNPRDYTLWGGFREDLHLHLIDRGVDISSPPAFIAAARCGRDDALRQVIEKGGVEREVLDAALYLAALVGRVDTTALLLDAGADPMARDGEILERAQGAVAKLLQERVARAR